MIYKGIKKRRICWPNPDAVCLQGGCSYCNDCDYKFLHEIWKYAQNKNLESDYKIGRENNWYNRISYK